MSQGKITVGKRKSAPKGPSKQELLEELCKDLPLYGEEDYEIKTEAVPSGSLSLDLALGVGGFPRGAIIDVFGGESAGKSLISIMLIAEVQKQGGSVVIWDAERSYSKNLGWMRTNGVDTKKLKFIKLRPEQGAEIGFGTIEKLVAAQVCDLIVIDSVPSLVPQAALDKQLTENQIPGARAGLLTNALSRLVPVLDDSRTILMVINQMRANIGGGMYGPSTKETSNFALKHYSSVRLAVRKITKSVVKENDVPVAHRVHVKCVKNKVAAPWREAEFELNYFSGVESASEVADILVSAGIVTKKGSWLVYDEVQYHGMPKLIEFFRDKKNLEAGIATVRALKINSFGVGAREETREPGTLSVEKNED